MNRRQAFAWVLPRLLVVAGFAVAPINADAQQGVERRIGVLAQDLQPGLLDTFRAELNKLGYFEGKQVSIEVRNAAGQNDRLPALVDDLLRLKTEVIVAVNTPAALAAKNATKKVPIVIMRVADPVKSGLVANLAQPGGNVTGLSLVPDELGAKGLEMLRETLPQVARVAALYQGDNPGARIVVSETERRSAELGLQFTSLPVHGSSDLTTAFGVAALARAEALFVMDDGAMTKHRRQILDLAASQSLPVVSIYSDFARAAVLLPMDRACPPSTVAQHFVDEILRGETPGRLLLSSRRSSI